MGVDHTVPRVAGHRDGDDLPALLPCDLLTSTVNELAPKDEKLELTEDLIPSIAVKIPTSDVMPMATIIANVIFTLMQWKHWVMKTLLTMQKNIVPQLMALHPIVKWS